MFFKKLNHNKKLWTRFFWEKLDSQSKIKTSKLKFFVKILIHSLFFVIIIFLIILFISNSFLKNHSEKIRSNNYFNREFLIDLSFFLLILFFSFFTIYYIYSYRKFKLIENINYVLNEYKEGNFNILVNKTNIKEFEKQVELINTLGTKTKINNNKFDYINDLQRSFTSDVSHELRTPLTSISLISDILEDKIPYVEDELKLLFTTLSKEVNRFKILLDDLLEISKFDSGTAISVQEYVSVKKVIENAISVVKPLYDETNVDLIFESKNDLEISAYIDSVRLERVLRNLLSNALDHSLGNPVVLEVASNRSFFSITVTDHGIGLNEEQLSRIFDRFWRADPSRKRMTGGTGLGLSISLEDIKLQNGTLEAYGEQNKGAIFRVTLPLKPLGLPINHALGLNLK